MIKCLLIIVGNSIFNMAKYEKWWQTVVKFKNILHKTENITGNEICCKAAHLLLSPQTSALGGVVENAVF